MGILWRTVEMLAETNRIHPFQGTLLQLGKQTIYSTKERVNAVLSKYSLGVISKEAELDDVALFKAMGFSAVESMDASDHENATLIHDLNLPVKPEHEDRFDVVFDSGTTEHVFDIKQSLENTVRMVKPGGIIIHLLPVNNWINHGFHQFSPTLFFDFYTANGFSILESYLIEYQQSDDKPWTVYACRPELQVPLQLAATPVLMYFATKKTEPLSSIHIPQQNMYVKQWGKHRDAGKEAETGESRQNLPKKSPPDALKKHRVYAFGRHIVHRYIRDAIRLIKNKSHKNPLPVHKRF